MTTGTQDSRGLRRGVFLTFEGLPPTIADSQVVTHLADMRESGFEIELWAFSITAERHAAAEARCADIESRHGIRVRTFRALRPAWPGSERINARRLRVALARWGREAQFVHARTEYPTVVAGLALRGTAVPLVWDCRGDTVAEAEPAPGAGPVRRLLAPWTRRRVRNRVRDAARVCDRAIFVSDALRALHESALGSRPSIVVPSVASERTFRFDPELRDAYRTRMGIAPSRTVAVYSGSMAPYQSFPESVRVFSRLRAVDPSLFLLVLTPYTAAATARLTGLHADDFRVVRAPFDEVNGYLNAADLGLLLRRPDPINRVASPVKFAEFCLAGLPVMLTEAVEQSAAFARRLGNGVFHRFGAEPPRPPRFDAGRRREVAAAARDGLSRESVRGRYADLYRA